MTVAMFRRRLSVLFRRCELTYFAERYAGHSKWQNIRHIKGEKDQQRSIAFSKIKRAMEVAMKEKGNADPKTNLQLAQAIEQAKNINMPSATIQTILHQFQEKKDRYYRILELKGPSRSAFILYLLTDNFHLVKQNINIILKRSNGAFAYGNMLHLFSQKAVIKVDCLPGTSLEKAIDHALEIEVDDVEEKEALGEKFLEFSCDPVQLNIKKTQLETLKYTVKSAEVEYSPLAEVVVSENDIQSINWLYNKLEEIPDIVNVYDNIAVS